MSPCKVQAINLRVPNCLCATELPHSEISSTEVTFHPENTPRGRRAGWFAVPSPLPEESRAPGQSRRLGWFAAPAPLPEESRTPGQSRRQPGVGSTGQHRSGSLGHIQPRQVLRARGIPASLKIDVLFSLLLTGQPCTVKTRRRLDWEFWLYVLCKP